MVLVLDPTLYLMCINHGKQERTKRVFFVPVEEKSRVAGRRLKGNRISTWLHILHPCNILRIHYLPILSQPYNVSLVI